MTDIAVEGIIDINTNIEIAQWQLVMNFELHLWRRQSTAIDKHVRKLQRHLQ